MKELTVYDEEEEKVKKEERRKRIRKMKTKKRGKGNIGICIKFSLHKSGKHDCSVAKKLIRILSTQNLELHYMTDWLKDYLNEVTH